MIAVHFLDRLFQDADLLPGQLQEITAKFRPVRFAKGDYLLRDGEVAKRYWFLETGFARSYATAPDGADTTTGFSPRATSSLTGRRFSYARSPGKPSRP